MNNWKSYNHFKGLLQYHVIFVCKYRHSLLENKKIDDEIKESSISICSSHKISIVSMETDKNHIHYLLEIPPKISISDACRIIKSYTTHEIWKLNSYYLRKYLWKSRVFWTRGYFACTIGNASESTIKKYIENQG